MERKIEKTLIKNLQEWRCVALLGPRQVGKSYLLKEILKKHRGYYLSLDDPLIREEVARDPVSYLERYYQSGEFLFIDEAAKVPEVFSAVKVLVDRFDPKPTGICLANSGNYLLMHRIKESLAGRVHLLPMYPLSWEELAGKNEKPGLFNLMQNESIAMPSNRTHFLEINRSREKQLLWGGYPTIALEQNEEKKIQWGNDYLRTYVLPLILEQFGIRDTRAFEQTARILLTQNGHALNASKIGGLIGVNSTTLQNYTQQLLAMMVIDLLPIYTKNAKKRLMKQPKIYAVDSLLLHLSLGTRFSFQEILEKEWVGKIYEAFILMEIKKAFTNYGFSAEYFTWRTQDKAEVDFIVTTQNKVLPFEVKWSKKISKRDLSGLKSFLEDNSDITEGYVIHPGEKIEKISEKIWLLPDWWLLGIF